MKKGKVSGQAWTSVLEEDVGLRHNHYVVNERQSHDYKHYLVNQVVTLARLRQNGVEDDCKDH
jgi:hypothetical protein